jgi:hypothetical protein
MPRSNQVTPAILTGGGRQNRKRSVATDDNRPWSQPVAGPGSTATAARRRPQHGDTEPALTAQPQPRTRGRSYCAQRRATPLPRYGYTGGAGIRRRPGRRWAAVQLCAVSHSSACTSLRSRTGMARCDPVAVLLSRGSRLGTAASLPTSRRALDPLVACSEGSGSSASPAVRTATAEDREVFPDLKPGCCSHALTPLLPHAEQCVWIAWRENGVMLRTVACGRGHSAGQLFTGP